MDDSSELLKSFANSLAKLASSGDNHHLIRSLQLAGLFGEPQSLANGAAPQDRPSGYGHASRVGIWERKAQNGSPHFVRTMDTADEWNMWANQGRIEAKGSKRRIVLIGESVARGYLYDPLFTPARVLELILRPHFPVGGVEVVDLARLNLSRTQLTDLVNSALLLEPDALV